MNIVFVISPDDYRVERFKMKIIPRKGDEVVFDGRGYVVMSVVFDFDDDEIRILLD